MDGKMWGPMRNEVSNNMSTYLLIMPATVFKSPFNLHNNIEDKKFRLRKVKNFSPSITTWIREMKTPKDMMTLEPSSKLDQPCRQNCQQQTRPWFLSFSLFIAGSILCPRSIFMFFYYRCTEILKLPSAARRLFNEKGVEIFSLKDLQRDELVNKWIWNKVLLYECNQRKSVLHWKTSDA